MVSLINNLKARSSLVNLGGFANLGGSLNSAGH